MPIAFDSAANSRTGSGTSQSHNHTCTGSNRGLLAAVIGDPADKVTGVTYNGVAMTLIAKALLGGSRWGYLFWLAAPATGVNSVVASASSATYLEIDTASYTGVSQTGQPEAFATNIGSSGATGLTASVTTLTDNAWVVGLAEGTSGAITAGAATVIRTSNLVGAAMDSNAAVSPAASRALAFTHASSAGVGAILASIAPAAAPTGPTISAHPANQTVTTPTAATFSVTAAASGGGILSYQWKNGASNVGTNSASLTTGATSVTGGSWNNGDQITVVVTETGGTNAGSITSNAATLTVNAGGGSTKTGNRYFFRQGNHNV